MFLSLLVFEMLIAAAFIDVLHSPLGVGLVVVFFALALTLLVTAFGFATRRKNRRAQGFDED